jgi:hypothetical protein
MVGTSLPRYRVLALDIDGTIADREFGVPRATIDAIQEAIEAGVLVSLATGRMRRSAVGYARLCGTNGPIICYQGAVTTSADHLSDIRHERLSPEVAVEAVSQMREAGGEIIVFLDDQIYASRRTEWAESYCGRMNASLHVVESLEDVAKAGPTVVVAVDELERTGALATSLRRKFGALATVTHSLPRFCEVASPLAGKHQALAHLAAQLGFTAPEVVAAGDEHADIAMLEWAGLAITVEDAVPAAKKAADRVVPGPERNGVADVIRLLLREGKLGG